MFKPRLLPLFLILLALPLAAQVDRGTITGSVLDSSGAVIPRAEVTATNMDTGVVSRAVTNEVGLYTLSAIPLGRYEIKITAGGFKTHTRSGITLTVGQMLRLDVTLQTGDVQESVTVSAEASLLKMDTAQVSTTIQSQVVTDLPLSFGGGRAIENFAYALTPAVEGNNWTSYIAGGPAFSKEVLIDGMSATAQIQGHVGESSPTMEAVQEFSVQTSGMSAEYGRTSGGVFNFALKSGTNQFNGSLFYYLRNEVLNANGWMNNWRLSQSPGNPRYTRARDRQFLGGGSAGGPVYLPKLYDGRNRTFIFGAFEKFTQERYQLSQDYAATVPIPEFLDGDFSKLLSSTVLGKDALGRDVLSGQIFDPTTLRKEGNRWIAEPFGGNIIPKARISALSQKITDIYRQSYQPMIPGRLTNNNARTQVNNPWFHQTQLTLKGDHAVSDSNKFSGSLIWTQRPRILADAGGVWDATDKTGGPFARARKQEVTSRAARVSNNWTITPTLLNTASIAYNRYRNPSLSLQAANDWNKTLGIDSVTDSTLFPDIGFGSAVNGVGITNIGYSSSGFYVANTYILGDNLVWVKGRHTMKFGGQAWRQQINGHAAKFGTMSYTFANSTTGLPGEPWANRVGFGFASFLLGEVASASKATQFDSYGRRNYVETYFQDDIKVNGRLTLNLGLRWEQAQPFYEKYGRWSQFNPDIKHSTGMMGALEFAKGPGDSFERNKDWKEFSPRFGAAYRLTDRAVLRGGYGVFFIPVGINYWSGVPYGFAPGFRGTNNVTGTGNVAKFNWDKIAYPDNYVPPTQDPNTLIWGMVAIDPDTLFQAYTQQYNVSFQYELSANLVGEVTYMGNQGRRLHLNALRRNQPLRSAYEDPKVNPTAWVSDAASAAAAGVPYPYAGWSGNAGMALQPYPHVAAVTWGPIYWAGASRGGSSGYNSFQFQLTKRMSNGLAAQASYNLSKAVGNVETAFDENWDANINLQDVNDLAIDAKTVLPYDNRHILKGYVQYQLPWGQGRKFLSSAPGWLNAIVGGWDITWMYKYNTGVPLGISPNVNRPGWEGAVYSDWNPSVDLSRKFDTTRFNPGKQNDPINLYFDQSAFSNPVNYKLGNGRRRYNELRGFGWSNEDIGVLKYWHFGETMSLQLRGELLNVFNRHHYANPGTGLGSTATFGYVTGMSGEPRNVQIGIRLGW